MKPSLLPTDDRQLIYRESGKEHRAGQLSVSLTISITNFGGASIRRASRLEVESSIDAKRFCPPRLRARLPFEHVLNGRYQVARGRQLWCDVVCVDH